MLVENDGEIVISTKVDTDGIEKGIVDIEREIQNLKDIDIEVDDQKIAEQIGERIDELVAEYKEAMSGPLLFESDILYAEELKQKIQNLAHALEEIYGEKVIIPGFTETDNTLSSIKDKIKGVGKSVENVGKKVSRMWLSLLGISTLFGTIRSSVSRITSKNEELKGKINSIKNAIDNVVSKLVDLVFPIIEKIIQYVGYLAKKIFNIDIFKKSTESAKKLDKTFAKFDEMQTLQSKDKEQDYSIKPLEEGKAPAWLRWLGKNAKKLAKYLLLIAGAIIGIKTGLGLIKGLGIGLILLGIYDTIKAIIDLINSPSVDNVAKVLKGIAEIVLGIGLAFGSLPATITGALLLIVAGLILYYDKIIGWFNKIINYVDEFKDMLRNKIGPIADILLAPITYAINFAKNLYDNFYGGIREFIGGILKIIDGDFIGGLLDMLEGAVKTMFAIPLAFWEAIKSVLEPIGDWLNKNVLEPIKEFFKPLISWIDTNIVQPVKEKFSAIKQALTTIFQNIGENIGTAIKLGLKGILNGILASIEAKLNVVKDVINKIKNFLVNTTIFGVLGILKIPDIPYISLPRLAKGGIVNKVGSGVPIGSAIAGERGREAVIPLTDSQQMAMLGQEIAKNVVINLTSIVDIDGRQLARSVNQVMNDMEFASNGGVI